MYLVTVMLVMFMIAWLIDGATIARFGRARSIGPTVLALADDGAVRAPSRDVR